MRVRVIKEELLNHEEELFNQPFTELEAEPVEESCDACDKIAGGALVYPVSHSCHTKPASEWANSEHLQKLLTAKIAAFDITTGIHGEDVKNPLMRLNDFKSLLLNSLDR